MKNYLTLVLALAVVSTPAFASRARLESLGQEKNGSYFIDDNRNIFLNPAQINNYKKKLWLEFGGTTYTTTDSQTASQNQGGFSNTFGDFTYGVFVGRQSDRVSNTLSLANNLPASTGTYIMPDHAIEIFFAGENAVKWGVEFYWAGAQSKTATANSTAGVMAAKLGIIADKLEAFTTIGINSSSKIDTGATASTNEVKGNMAFDLGVTYAVDSSLKAKANFSTFGSKINIGGTDQGEAKTMLMSLGAGWKKEVAKSVSMWSIVSADYQKNSVEKAAFASSANNNYLIAQGAQQWYNIPLTLAAEAQATSWLAIRGNVSHSLLGQQITAVGGVKNSLNNQTTVAAGMGMTFGDVQIDGMFGQSTAVAAQGYILPARANSNDVQGFGNNFISRLALTYNF